MSNPINTNVSTSSISPNLPLKRRADDQKIPQDPIPSAINAIALVGAVNSQQLISNASSSNENFTFSHVRTSNTEKSEIPPHPTKSQRIQNCFAEPVDSGKMLARKPINIFAIPSDALETILKSSGVAVKDLQLVSKQFNHETNRTIEGFWLENFENPQKIRENPAIEKHINTLKTDMGLNTWNVLSPLEKLNRLYHKMLKEVKDIDPVRFARLQNRVNIQSHIWDFSLYQQLALIEDFNLIYLQRAMTPRLPEITNFSRAELRNWMRNRENTANLRWVSLTNVDITALPPEIECLIDLSYLSIQHTNNLNALRNNIRIPKLLSLNLSNTQIETLPNNIHLPNLRELTLSHTPISSWPNNLHLPHLMTLDLDNTRMSTLPHNLPNLHAVELSHTQITTLPERIELPSLRTLFLSETPLTQTEEGKELALEWGIRHGVEVVI